MKAINYILIMFLGAIIACVADLFHAVGSGLDWLENWLRRALEENE